MASRPVIRPLLPGTIPTAMERTWGSGGLLERDRTMVQGIAEVTNLKDWQNRREEWKSQVYWLLARAWTNHVDITRAEIFERLDLLIKVEKEHGFISSFGQDMCVPVGEGLIPASIDAALKSFAERNARPDREYWQVRATDGEVRHSSDFWGIQTFLDPAMYAVDRYRTKTLASGEVDSTGPWKSMGQGSVDVTMKVFEAAESPKDDMLSQFQRLPSQVKIQDGHAKITSYVNGLRPDDVAMCSIFEKIMDRVLPMWQQCIDGAFMRLQPVLNLGDNAMDYRLSSPAARPATADLMNLDSNLQVIIQGETIDRALAFKVTEDDERNANYSKGWWRSAGSAAEHVCAVAIYCYEADPHTDVYLDIQAPLDCDYLELFLKTSTPDGPEGEGTRKRILRSLGIDPFFSMMRQAEIADYEKPPVNSEALSMLSLRPGRIIVIPACFFYRIRVHGKPGRCGLLTMSIIDPGRPILSTARVPPQSRDWLPLLIRKMPWFSRLPEELWKLICSFLEMAWREADLDNQPLGCEPLGGFDARHRKETAEDRWSCEQNLVRWYQAQVSTKAISF